MANLQNHFNNYHKAIKVDWNDQRNLASKRDIIIDKIKATLKANGKPVPTLINKGSYIHGVGVEPVDSNDEYDIDVGLIFDIKSSEYSAKEVRQWALDAIKDHTKNVENKGPCIRVRYTAGYHVDITIYARYKDFDSIVNFQLARKNDSWEDSDPERLKSEIEKHKKLFDGTTEDGTNQFCRVVRYLKRWNDYYNPRKTDNKPFGLAFVLLAREVLTHPVKDFNQQSDDLEALLRIADRGANWIDRISISKPVIPFEDVFSKIDDDGMTALKNRFKKLADTLRDAKAETDEIKACEVLRSVLGDDFPVPMKTSDSLDSLDNVDRSALASDLQSKHIKTPTGPWCSGK